ncbi:MAG: sugar phosphate isomerase/epimerase family protein [Aureliella sp.]
MKRRHFAQLTAAATLTTALSKQVSAFLPMIPAKNGLGLQLWTVRNQLEESVEKTIKAVADAGYKQVELMRVIDSEDVVKAAKDNGLEVRSAFINWESVVKPSDNTPDLSKILDKANEYGLEYIVFGYVGKSERDSADKIKGIIDSANAAAEKSKAAGLKLSYHNHSFEFEPLDGDTNAFEMFVDGFDKELIDFELDVFWAAIGGYDAVDTMKRLGRRVGQVHLKDLKKDTPTIFDEGKVPEDAFQEVGDGILDMKQIMEIAVANGVQQFHVEQDASPDPIKSIGQSAKYVADNLWG